MGGRFPTDTTFSNTYDCPTCGRPIAFCTSHCCPGDPRYVQAIGQHLRQESDNIRKEAMRESQVQGKGLY